MRLRATLYVFITIIHTITSNMYTATQYNTAAFTHYTFKNEEKSTECTVQARDVKQTETSSFFTINHQEYLKLQEFFDENIPPTMPTIVIRTKQHRAPSISRKTWYHSKKTRIDHDKTSYRVHIKRRSNSNKCTFVLNDTLEIIITANKYEYYDTDNIRLALISAFALASAIGLLVALR